MKKVVIGCLIIALLISSVSCGKGKGEVKDEIKEELDNLVEEEQKQEKHEDGSGILDDNKKNNLVGTYKIPMISVYIDVPGYPEKEEGYTELFVVDGVKYVAITTLFDDNISELSDAHNLLIDEFILNIQTYSYVNSLNIEKESTETINGIEAYRYEGTYNCGHDTIYDAYAVGYSFIIDGIPYNITGSVTEESQSEDLIEEIRTTVDAMMQTVRTEK